MHRPSSMTEQQWQQIRSFINSEILMTPQQFRIKWDVTQAFLAEICHCHESTVSPWFASGRNYSPPLRHHKLELALGDLIIEKYEELPVFLQQQFCPDLNR